jgi:soluble lytic murein transglycosylase-like protein
MNLKKLLKGNGKYVAGGVLALLLVASAGKGTSRNQKVSLAKKSKGGGQKTIDRVRSNLPFVRKAHEIYKDVPIPVILTIMHIESGGDPDAESHSGALGLMQIYPGKNEGIWKQYGLTRTTATEAWYSIETGTQILHELIAHSKKKWGGDFRYVVAGYNRGAGTIDHSFPRIDAKGQEYLAMYNKAAPLYANAS